MFYQIIKSRPSIKIIPTQTHMLGFKLKFSSKLVTLSLMLILVFNRVSEWKFLFGSDYPLRLSLSDFDDSDSQLRDQRSNLLDSFRVQVTTPTPLQKLLYVKKVYLLVYIKLWIRNVL